MTVTIQSPDLALDLDPKRGGCVVRLDWIGPNGPRPVLRQAASDFGGTGDATQASAFVAAPFFGPVTGGWLPWSGRRHRILHNHPDEPEPIHGEAWRGRWEVEATTATTATLSYAHVPFPGLFPAAFTVWQVLELRGPVLMLTLRLENRSPAAFDGGLAWHPYVPKFADTMFGGAASGLWSRRPLETGRSVTDVPEEFRFGRARRWGGLVADDTYEGWDGTAVIGQPGLGFDAILRAEAPLSRLQVFSPEGASFLCVEPTSNVPDAHRLKQAGLDSHGLVSLEPGAQLSATLTLTVLPHDAPQNVAVTPPSTVRI